MKRYIVLPILVENIHGDSREIRTINVMILEKDKDFLDKTVSEQFLTTDKERYKRLYT